MREKPVSEKHTTKTCESSVILKSPGSVLPSLDVPDGEDETSFERHNKLIRTELAKKGKGKKAVLDDLIYQSFAMRRKDISNNIRHSQVLLEKYPFLKKPDEVIQCNVYIILGFLHFYLLSQLITELERICKCDVLTRKSWAVEWSPRVLAQAELEKTSNARLRKAMSTFSEDASETLTNTAYCNYSIYCVDNGILALCLLPYLLSDPRTKSTHEKLVHFCSVSFNYTSITFINLISGHNMPN